MIETYGQTQSPKDLTRDGSLPPLLKRFQTWTLGLFLFSVCFHLVCWLVLHLHGHMVYPFSLNSQDRFGDFTIFREKFKLFHTAEFFQVGFPINYPAITAVGLKFFFLLPHSLSCFLAFCILGFTGPSALFARTLARRGVAPTKAWTFAAVCCLLSWPMLLIVDGANAEIFVWYALLIGMWSYSTGRLWIAAVFFGVAASIKLFPFVFLALFLRRGRLGQLFTGAISFVVVSLAGLKILGPTIAIANQGINYGLNSFRQNYMAQWHTGEQGVDHSIFAFIKLVGVTILHHPPLEFMGWLRIYLAATAIFGVLLYFRRIRRMPLMNQVLCLSIACIYFTPFSGDGTLLHLYYPLAMLLLLALKAWQDGVIIAGLSVIIGTMAFCLSMESFIVIPHLVAGARFIGPAHAVSLGIMLVTALRYPLGPPLAETGGETSLSQPTTEWVAQTAN